MLCMMLFRKLNNRYVDFKILIQIKSNFVFYYYFQNESLNTSVKRKKSKKEKKSKKQKVDQENGEE